MALLGEMERTSGTQVIPKNPSVVDEHGLQNSIAYAAQTPWLQQQSIKVCPPSPCFTYHVCMCLGQHHL